MQRLVDERSPWATRVSPSNIHSLPISHLDNQFNRFTLLMSPPLTLINWLQNNNLLASSMKCDKCHEDCTMNARKKTIDGYSWRCKNRHEISLRRYSFFSQSHLYLPDIINFILNYADGYSLWKCANNSAVAYGNTAVDWVSFCRDLFIQYYCESIRPVKFSGTVEIDESLFGRRMKYHRGHARGQKVWIFGLVERDTNRMKLFPVDKRNSDILIKLIQENVEQGSTIYSDGWAAYKSLNSLGYKHYIVEHKHTFKQVCKDPTTGNIFTVHTNTIEGCWKHAKAHFRRMNGTKLQQFEGHLCEIMWRWWEKGSRIGSILKLIQLYYPLNTAPRMTATFPVFPSWFNQQQASQDDTMCRLDSSDNDENTDTEMVTQEDESLHTQQQPASQHHCFDISGTDLSTKNTLLVIIVTT